MSRRGRMARNVLIGAGALLFIAVLAVVVVVRTVWFRNYVRQEIVSATEDSTGGRVEIGSFDFDEPHLRVTIGNFVIHGNEPAGSPPFLRVNRIVADIRVVTGLTKFFSLSYLGLERPEANILILADGRTNIPSPRNKTNSQESPLKTVADLAVERFELNNGTVALDSRKQPFNLRGNNLRAQLSYSLLSRNYSGQISLEPFYVVSGRNAPVTIRVTLPLTIGSDRIEVHRASISTPGSMVSIDGSFEDARTPRVTARIDGSLAVADLKNAGDLPLAVNQPGVPGRIELAANVTASTDSIQVTEFQATMGHSHVEAFGPLRDPHGTRTLTFQSSIDIGEIGKLIKAGVKPRGGVVVDGNAQLGPGHGELALTSLEVTAFGGHFLGSASVRDFHQYKVNGELRGFDARTVLSALAEKVPYDGVVSGSVAAVGDTKADHSMVAQTRLFISPGRHGIPVSGRLNADYNGASDNIVVEKSYIVLPHSRLDFNGSLDKVLNVSLKTGDLHDLLAPDAVALNRGEAGFSGTVTSGVKGPRIAGHLAINRLVVEGRQFDTIAADIAASSSGAAIRNGVLTRSVLNKAPMQASFAGSLGLTRWKALPRGPVSADLSILNGDLADVAVLAGRNSGGYSGSLSAAAHVAGTLGNPLGTVSLQVAKGTIDGQPFDQASVQANLTDQLVTIPAASVQAAAGRVDLNGEFRHPADSFTTGHLHAGLKSNAVDLANTPVGQQLRNNSGTVQVNANVAGELSDGTFLPTSVSADVSAHALRIEGQSYGDLEAAARTTGRTTTYNLTSNFAGSTVRLHGNTQLVRDYPTTADADIANLPVDKVLAAAKRTDVPARGSLSGMVHLTGTVSDPQGEANLDLTRAVVYDEPIDQFRLRAAYRARAIDISQLEIATGPSRIEMTAHYDHPAGNLLTGNAKFDVQSSRIDLARIHNVQARRPGLGGVLQITARGDGLIGETAPRITLRGLNLNIAATGIAAQGKHFGDLKLTANSVAGNKVDFALDSSLADAAIHGRGTVSLAAGYPVDAQLSFNNLLYTHIASLLEEKSGSMEAAVDGQLTVNGPLLDHDQLRANFELTRLNISAKPGPGKAKPMAIANQGPVTATLNHGSIQIQNAHLSGSQADVQVAGSASLTSLNVSLNAKVGLEILPNFDQDIYSSGNVDLAATVRGTASQPLINGQLTLRNAAFNYAGLPAGISNANGVVVFNGNNAIIRNLTAEAGGGKVTVTGFAGYTDGARFGLRVKASRVRARLQPGVSVIAGADLQLSGTSRNSVVSGSALIEQVTYNPRTDIASILSRATPAVQSSSSQSPALDNMRLDIRVRSSSALSVQADIAENLSANADVRVRGTIAQPGVLGRITINEGRLVFFGSTYTVDTGTIAFYNPLQIDPVLDLSLETQAQGVNVVVRVTGPVDNMKLSYTSNPPLQFQEIVGLLAAGRTPTSDPTLLANQPNAPASSFQQMGESALLGEAVANPAAGRLQRVFGVSQLKVDPAFQGGSEVPTARLTLQQRITSNLTFTYTSALDDPNGEIVQVQWAFDPKWSAVATRDQNGIFSINFLYKRQFR
jgi:translocation and assembly module TamB